MYVDQTEDHYPESAFEENLKRWEDKQKEKENSRKTWQHSNGAEEG